MHPTLFLILGLPFLVASVSAQKTEPEFSDFTETKKANETTTRSTTDVKTALQDALKREKELEKQLADTKAQLSKNSIPVVGNIQPTDQNQLASKLLGPQGIFSILKPQILDQQDAAAKLIPPLTIPQQQARPAAPVQAQVPQQMPAYGQQMMDPRVQNTGQMPTQFGQNAFPTNQFGSGQFPQLGTGFGTGFQQPSMTNSIPSLSNFGLPASNLLPQQTFAQPQFGQSLGGNFMTGR